MLVRRARRLRRRRRDREPVDRGARRRRRGRAARAGPRLPRRQPRGHQFAQRPDAALPGARPDLALRRRTSASRSSRSTTWDVPLLSDIPCIGPILFQQDPLLYLALLRGAGGLVRAVPDPRRPADPDRGGALGGLGVHGYSVQTRARTGRRIVGGCAGRHRRRPPRPSPYANAWFENMIAGRGFIAVALVIFAMWNPFRVMAGAYLFGTAIALASGLQARGYEINQFALDAVPFVLTLLVLAVLGKRRCRRPGRAAKRVFENSRTRHLTRLPAPQPAPRASGADHHADTRHTAGVMHRRGGPRGARRLQPAPSSSTPARRHSRRTASDAARPGKGTTPSASSWSARRTTSATTRPSTRASRPQEEVPRHQGARRVERPRGRHAPRRRWRA